MWWQVAPELRGINRLHIPQQATKTLEGRTGIGEMRGIVLMRWSETVDHSIRGGGGDETVQVSKYIQNQVEWMKSIRLNLGIKFKKSLYFSQHVHNVQTSIRKCYFKTLTSIKMLYLQEMQWGKKHLRVIFPSKPDHHYTSADTSRTTWSKSIKPYKNQSLCVIQVIIKWNKVMNQCSSPSPLCGFWLNGSSCP